MNRTRDHQKEKGTTPKACPPACHVAMSQLTSLSSRIEKGGFHGCAALSVSPNKLQSENGEARNGGQQFQHSLLRPMQKEVSTAAQLSQSVRTSCKAKMVRPGTGVKHGKKADCFTLLKILNELPIQNCKFRSQIQRVQATTLTGIPLLGSCHLVGFRHE